MLYSYSSLSRSNCTKTSNKFIRDHPDHQNGIRIRLKAIPPAKPNFTSFALLRMSMPIESLKTITKARHAVKYGIMIEFHNDL